MVIGIHQEGNKKLVSAISITVVALFFIMTIFSVYAYAEMEPNNSTYTADPISSGDTATGTLNEFSDPDDYYSIYLSEGERLTATLSGTGDDFDLYLYDPNHNYLDSSESYDSSETLRHTASSSGTYYVNPYAYSGSGSYALSVTVTQGGTVGPSDWVIPLIVIVVIVIIIIVLAIALKPKHKAPEYPPQSYGYANQGQYAPPPPVPQPGHHAPPPPAAPGAQAPPIPQAGTQPESGGFCGSCGAKMNAGFPRCPSCGSNN